jgi:hypothetical protein
MNIPFGITFKRSKYNSSEVSEFINCSTNLDEPLQTQYHQFLNDWLDGKITKSTPIDVEVLETFHSDLDNRCQIDYREDHGQSVFYKRGGKRFGQAAIKLANHLKSYDIEVKWL